MEKYEVVISPRFFAMLGGHAKFLKQASPEATGRLKAAMMKAIRSLEKTPERYPFFDADFIPPNKYHKMFVDKSFIILYQIKDKTVFVDYVIDCRQDYGWLL